MTTWMDGYTRDPQVTERLIAALRVALYATPEQRLGQLLTNLNPSGGLDLWGIKDEVWIGVLEGFDVII